MITIIPGTMIILRKAIKPIPPEGDSDIISFDAYYNEIPVEPQDPPQSLGPDITSFEVFLC